MNQTKTTTPKNWLRPIFGGAISAIVNYVIFHHYPAIFMIVVPTSAVVGLYWCICPERIFPSMIQSVICGIMFFIMSRWAIGFMAKDPLWWKVVPESILLGMLGGVSVGALIGGVSRYIFDAIGHTSNGGTKEY